MQRALIGSLIVGGICAYLGVYVVLRRIVFVGVALAQVSSAGVGLAVLTGQNPSLMSILMTLGGVAAFSVKARDRKVTQESYIGIGYALAAALAVLFIAKSAKGEGDMLELLKGDVLTIVPADIWWMAGAAVVVLAIHTLFHKQFLFSAFDPETAEACGIKSSRWDLLFFVMLGVIIALSIKLVGTLLVFGFLVLPAVSALLLSQHLGKIYAVAICSSVIATVLGLYASMRLEMPSGPTIAAVSFILLVVAWIISKFKD
jgi:ABC-type Mn2+/Zn2+ transport system permease subunit